jgi:hypothetical protein
MKLAIAKIGPIAVGIYVSENFQNYESGVFTENSVNCPIGEANHAVNLVGYGTSSTGQDYYILRNQWGTSWGMQGYMYFTRDTIGNTNVCEIASFASYPIVKSEPNANSIQSQGYNSSDNPNTTVTNSFSTTMSSARTSKSLNSTALLVLTSTSTKKCINCKTYMNKSEKKTSNVIYLSYFLILRCVFTEFSR